jgi:hypothetical protein
MNRIGRRTILAMLLIVAVVTFGIYWVAERCVAVPVAAQQQNFCSFPWNSAFAFAFGDIWP